MALCCFIESCKKLNDICCAVTFSTSLPSLSVATFQSSQQNDFKSAVLSKAKGATSCSLTRWYDGSLQVETAVSFPKSDSSAVSNAASFANVLKTDISSVFPPATYGAVTVANVAQQTSKSEISFVIGFVVVTTELFCCLTKPQLALSRHYMHVVHAGGAQVVGLTSLVFWFLIILAIWQ